MDEEYYKALGGVASQRTADTLPTLQELHKRLQEQFNLIVNMEIQARDHADCLFGSQLLDKCVNDDSYSKTVAPTLIELVRSIEGATARLQSQLNRF